MVKPPKIQAGSRTISICPLACRGTAEYTHTHTVLCCVALWFQSQKTCVFKTSGDCKSPVLTVNCACSCRFSSKQLE